MSSRTSEPQIETRTPRETTALFGHAEAEAALLEAFRSERIPHAWLLGGPRGIGKATLAYRMARFVLSHPNPAEATVRNATTLAVSPESAVTAHVNAGTHGGLLVLERTVNDKGVLRTAISVEETRETITFFGSTAAVDGWRVCIVDTVDELNQNSSNALLKVLEEPPPRALFLLVSHAPARVLATIQSRCRKLPMRPLASEDVIHAAACAADLPEDDAALMAAAASSEGSVGQALALLSGKVLGLHQRTTALLEKLPHVDPLALHALGDALAGNDRTVLTAFVESVEVWLSAQLHRTASNANLPRLARISEVWEKIGRAAREAEIYNLDRKPLVFSMFGLLADVARELPPSPTSVA